MADNRNKAILTPSRIFIYGVLVKNPILVQVIGLCPAVAACADIYVATLLSAVILILLISCEIFASGFLKKASIWARISIYFVIGLLISSAATILCEKYIPQIANTAGIYLPLMAASSAAALRCENFAIKKSARLSFYDALANGLGTALVLLFTGFVRGLLSVGTIGDFVVFKEAPISGLSMPFGGFIMLGFSAAFLKWFISTFLSDFSHDMSFGIKRTKKKKTNVVETINKTEKEEPKPSENTVPEKEQDSGNFLPMDELYTEDFSLDEELDSILSGFSSLESILEDMSVSKEGEKDE